MPADSPNHTRDARKLVTAIRDRFKADLVEIAERIAKANSAESVLRLHVDAALQSLKSTGLEQRGKWPRICLAVGSGLIGSSLSVAGFALTLLQMNGEVDVKTAEFWGFVIVGPVAMAIVGVGMSVLGWLKTP